MEGYDILSVGEEGVQKRRSNIKGPPGSSAGGTAPVTFDMQLPNAMLSEHFVPHRGKASTSIYLQQK